MRLSTLGLAAVQKSYVARGAIALGVGLVATTAVAGSAASLGGISDTGLGADAGAVVSCDTDGVTTSYTTEFLSSQYVVPQVTVTGINPACAGKKISVALSSGTTSLSTAEATVGGTSVAIPLTVKPSAVDVVKVSVAIA